MQQVFTRRPVFVDLAGTDRDNPFAGIGQLAIMGHQHQRHAAFLLNSEHQVGDAPAGLGIQIPGRFIGNQQGRPRGQSARNGNALLFAAGQFGWIVGHPLAKTDAFQFAAGAVEGIGRTGKLQRNGDIFQRRHIGNQMKRLKHNADMRAAEYGKLIFGQCVKGLAGNLDHAAIGPFQPADHHQQGGLARTARSDQPERGAALHFEGKSLQYVNPSRTAAEAEMNIVQSDGRPAGLARGYFGHDILPYMECGRSLAATATIDLLSYGKLLMHCKIIPAAFLVAWLAALSSAPAMAEQKTVLAAFGDSLSAGYQLPPEAAFPDQLQAALTARGLHVEVRNAAVSGDTASGGLSRLDWSIGEDIDGVILELGANDALRGVDPEITRAALDSALARFAERGIEVLLAGMLAPPNLGADYGRQFNAIYPELADKYDVILYPFFLDGVAGQKALNLADGMHPTAEGIAIVVERILPAVEALLDRIENAS